MRREMTREELRVMTEKMAREKPLTDRFVVVVCVLNSFLSPSWLWPFMTAAYGVLSTYTEYLLIRWDAILAESSDQTPNA